MNQLHYTDVRIESRALPPMRGKPALFRCMVLCAHDGEPDYMLWLGESHDAGEVRGMAERAMADVLARGHVERNDNMILGASWDDYRRKGESQ